MNKSKMRLRRNQLGVSQDDLAAATGLTQTLISNIERGLTPNENQANLIAYELNVKPESLFKTINK